MYEQNNCGEKIKKWSEIVAKLGVIGSAVIGVVLFVVFAEKIGVFALVLGLAWAIVFAILWWFVGLLCYGFGEIVSYAILKKEECEQPDSMEYQITANDEKNVVVPREKL